MIPEQGTQTNADGSETKMVRLQFLQFCLDVLE
jgi:hypothetical protein